MTFVYFANNRLGLRVLEWLVAAGSAPAGLVVHPPERAKFRDELIIASRLRSECVRDATAIATVAGLAWLRDLAPEWLVSVFYGYVLGRSVLGVPATGSINLHTALLPYNRGAYPNVWSLVDRTPAGVTLHHLDAGVDTGDIIAQRQVPVGPTDTGATLYAKLEDAAFELFRDTWHDVLAGKAERRPQPPGGTTHRARDVEAIDRVDPDRVMRVGDLIDVLRARSFPPHRGAYLDLPSGRVYMRIELTEENTPP